MSFIGDYLSRAVQGAAQAGIEWGKSAAQAGWGATKALADRATTKAIDTANAARSAAQQAAAAVQQGARNAAGAGAAAAAEKGTAWAVADKQRFENMRSKLDKRDRFTSRVVEPCPEDALTKHPDKRDGHFMGADCPATHAAKPEAGTKPDGCDCGKGGQPLPKVMFTNGINNTPAQVCTTMHALANSRCVEVIGVFNATYQDPTVAAPGRRLADYADAAKEGGMGALKDGATGLLMGALPGALRGAAVGLVKGAAPDLALQEASRLGLVQDIVDCIDTINKGSAEAAAVTLGKEIVAGLNGNPPQMTIYAHSQGGLNAGAAIAQAKRELELNEQARLMRTGLDRQSAKSAAAAYAEQKLSGLNVNTFGTLERGLPDGPTYNRFTNEYDPVPKVIREAQKGLTPELVTRDPLGAPPVQTFSAAPSMNPMDAHGMNETYIPWLNAHRPQGKCC